MDFNLFAQHIPKIENIPLIGQDAHYKMVPEFRAELLRENKKINKKPRLAGVMSLFYPSKNEQTKLLLILRKTYKGVHSNQIAFPGGKAEEEDATILETALRETHEEVGVLPHEITVLKQCTDVYIPPSNFLVTPFMGLCRNPLTFTLEEKEVEAIIEVSLDDFLDDKSIITKNITTSYAKDVNVPAFKLNGYVVWGATAMMLNEMKLLIKGIL